MATRRWIDRWMDWWFGGTPPNQVPLTPDESPEDNPFRAEWHAALAHSGEPGNKPTLTEFADLLDELTTQGMPPRGQARHVAFHWPAMVRKEEN